MYISLASSFNHCTQGTIGDGGDTPTSLGRCSVINKEDVISVSTVSSKLLDLGDKGVAVLKVMCKVGELTCFHVMVTGVKAVVGGGEGV